MPGLDAHMNDPPIEIRRKPQGEAAEEVVHEGPRTLDILQKGFKSSLSLLGAIIRTIVGMVLTFWSQQDVSMDDRLAEERSCKQELRQLETRLFHVAREARNYLEAESCYNRLVTGREPGLGDDPDTLDLKQSFGKMLLEQGRLMDAEIVSREVWKKRIQPSGAFSEKAKQSHRLLSSILTSMQRFKDAEEMHNTSYHKASHDAWSLENGDELCQRLADQGKFEKAKCTQYDIWMERWQQLGPRDELTVKSGMRTIEFLEKLIASVGNMNGSGAQRRHRKKQKQAFNTELELRLEEIWESRLDSESNSDILEAGHKLANSHFLRDEFAAAQAILELVWNAKKETYGQDDVSTLCTGSLLGKTLYRQENMATTRRSVEVLRVVWDARQMLPRQNEDDVVLSGDDLAQAYCSISDYASAEAIHRWILTLRTRSQGWTGCGTIQARWNLGQVLNKQLPRKSRDAEIILSEIYEHWKGTVPPEKELPRCGYLLAQTLEALTKTNNALAIMRDIFSREEAIQVLDAFYLESRHLFGQLLLKTKDFREAERILEQVWKLEVKGDREKQIRLECGNLFAKCLIDRKAMTTAKNVLDAVQVAQLTDGPTGEPQIAETQKLLRHIRDKESPRPVRKKKLVWS